MVTREARMYNVQENTARLYQAKSSNSTDGTVGDDTLERM